MNSEHRTLSICTPFAAAIGASYTAPFIPRGKIDPRRFRFGRMVKHTKESAESRGNRLARRHWLTMLAVSLVACLQLPTTQPSHAQQTGKTADPQAEFVYKLTKGRFPLCRDFARLLESYGPVPKYACNIPVKPEAGPFRRIDWSPVDPSSERGLLALKLAAEYGNRRGASDEDWDRKWETELRAVRQADVAAGRARLEEARLDLDFDGTPDRVYRFGSARGQCRSPDPQDPVSRRWKIVVLPDDDPLLSEEVVRKRPVSAADFFYYEGRPFAARYFASSLNILQFFRLQNNSVVREGPGNFYYQYVCEFDAEAAASAE